MAPKPFLALLIGSLLSCSSVAGPLGDAVSQLNLEELRLTFDAKKVDRILHGYGRNLERDERQAAAVLIALGALEQGDLRQPDKMVERLTHFQSVMNDEHPALIGRLGDVSVQMRLSAGWRHDGLLTEEVFLEALGEQLAKGVITGYDLRMKGIYDDLPEGHTFIYSQSSLIHMQQLVALLDSENINGWVYITPKVSAFLFREDWGPASENVKTIAEGLRVIQGREVAVLFQFDDPRDRYRFHELITRYAKKDEEEEKGLIANAWWQPFYYTDTPMEGFKPITLLVLSDDSHEATLTVLEEKADAVVDAFSDSPFALRKERVWVNPPFYRFLKGGFK